MALHQVQVNVIQCLSLIPQKSNNRAVPICQVECFDKQQTTKCKEDTLNPFWDHAYVFEENRSIDGQSLIFRVYDTDTWFTKLLIGELIFELAAIYDMKDHEMYKQWHALTLPIGDSDALQVAGFIRVSVVVINCDAGDALPARDAEDDPFSDAATDNADSLATAILQNPKISKEGNLVWAMIIRAEDLIQCDMFTIGEYTVAVKFSGGKEKHTSESDNERNPKWNQQISIMVKNPAPAKNIEFQLWQHDLLSKTMVSNLYVPVESILGKDGKTDKVDLGPMWLNFYNHPDDLDVRNMIRACVKKGKDEPVRTRFCGRVLVQFKFEFMNDLKAPNDGVMKINTAVGQPPENVDYGIHFDLYGCSDVSSEKLIMPLVKVELTWGSDVQGKGVSWTSSLMRRDDKTLRHYFDEQMPNLGVEMPQKMSQVPPVVLNLMMMGFDSLMQIPSWYRVAYKVLKPFYEIPPICDMKENPNGGKALNGRKFIPEWIEMDLDIVHGHRAAKDTPIYLLVRIGVTTEGERIERPKIVEPLMEKFVLRAHVFQARGLFPADACGTSDPYVLMQCGPSYCRTTTKYRTLSPVWYEDTGMTTYLPVVDTFTEEPTENFDIPMPQVLILIYDANDFPWPDVVIGGMSIPVSQDLHVSMYETYKPRRPKWRDVFRTEGTERKACGSLLISFDVMHPLLASEPTHTMAKNPIKPLMQENQFLEITFFGMRDLQPPPAGFMGEGYKDPMILIRVGDKCRVIPAGNHPNAKNPLLIDVVRIPVELAQEPDPKPKPGPAEPGCKPGHRKAPMYYPNLIVEAFYYSRSWMGTSRVGIGRFDVPIDIEGKFDGSCCKEDLVSPELMAKVCEENGIDLVLGAGGAGAEVGALEGDSCAMPDTGEEDADSDEEEEKSKKKGGGGDGGEEAKEEDELGEGEGEQDEHEPCQDFPQEYEPNITDLKYKRFVLQRPAPPNFNPFTLSYDRTPSMRDVGIFKANMALVNGMEMTALEDSVLERSEDAEDEDLVVGGIHEVAEAFTEFESAVREVDEADMGITWNRFHRHDLPPEDLEFGIIGYHNPLKPEDDFPKVLKGEDGGGTYEVARVEATSSDKKNVEKSYPTCDPIVTFGNLYIHKELVKTSLRALRDHIDTFHNKTMYQTIPDDGDDLDAMYDNIMTGIHRDVFSEEGFAYPPDISKKVLYKRYEEIRKRTISAQTLTIHLLNHLYCLRKTAEWKYEFRQREFILRVAIYRGVYLVPTSGKGNKTNPILQLDVYDEEPQVYPERGKKGIYPMVKGTLAPDWRHSFDDVNVTLPGSSVIKLTVSDRQEGLTFDTITEIGYTKIDLEDRMFSDKWMRQVETAYRFIPTEQRSLKNDSSKAPRGKLIMFLHLLRPELARDIHKYPKLNIKGPPPQDYELRTTIIALTETQNPVGHETDGIPSNCCTKYCCPSGIHLQVEVRGVWKYPEDDPDAIVQGFTDTQLYCDKQCANFNWRMIFPVTIPCKFHFLEIRIISAGFTGLFKGDSIAENVFNMKSFFHKIHEDPSLDKVVISKAETLIEMKHPKAGDRIMAKVSIAMELVRPNIDSKVEIAQGKEAWGKKLDKARLPLTLPKREPNQFSWWNPYGWVVWLCWRYKWQLILLLIIVLLGFGAYVYIQIQMLSPPDLSPPETPKPTKKVTPRPPVPEVPPAPEPVPPPETPPPVTPRPVTPVPITPVPVTPIPITPVPVTPVPITPVPITPIPVTPVPATPKPPGT